MTEGLTGRVHDLLRPVVAVGERRMDPLRAPAQRVDDPGRRRPTRRAA
ncbi:hypothetical protein [Streptomyces sp. c-19]